MVEDVVKSAVGSARSFGENPVEQAIDRLLDIGIARDLAGLPVCRATHCGIRWSALDDNGEASIGNALHDGRFGHANHIIDSPSFEKSLRKNALLPITPLHGESGECGFVDAVF